MTTEPLEPWDVAQELAKVVAALELIRRNTDKAAKRAIAANRDAANDVTAALIPYRALMAALVDNAGTDSRTTLEEALTNARAALEVPA